MVDEPVAVCPTCGGACRRLFFPAGIVFKGSGFYKTDSRKVTGDGSATSTSSSGKGSSDGGSTSTATPAGTAGD
jgi:predicted nucleic acid-binding Zn ribbon protein